MQTVMPSPRRPPSDPHDPVAIRVALRLEQGVPQVFTPIFPADAAALFLQDPAFAKWVITGFDRAREREQPAPIAVALRALELHVVALSRLASFTPLFDEVLPDHELPTLRPEARERHAALLGSREAPFAIALGYFLQIFEEAAPSPLQMCVPAEHPWRRAADRYCVPPSR